MGGDFMGDKGEEWTSASDFGTLLGKAIRLKEFAIKNGYEVDPKTITALNELRYGQPDSGQPRALTREGTADDMTKLDTAITELTAVTFPTTIDLQTNPESDQYKRFKWWLGGIGVAALLGAIAGFWRTASAANGGGSLSIGNSVLAVSLGLLGAVTYSLFNVLRVVPPQAFNPKDEYYNYARLLLGVLLGWVFYFAFVMDAFRQLADYLKGQATPPKAEAFKLLVPFMAGYSTKFVVGVLERAIEALEVALGIEERRDVRAKRVLSRRTSSSAAGT
jgi:hypothetical protein